jgi:hypothetical protein
MGQHLPGLNLTQVAVKIDVAMRLEVIYDFSGDQ